MIPLGLEQQQDPGVETALAYQKSVIAMDPLTAAYESSWEDSPMGAIARTASIREAEANGQTPITPNEANAKFPNMRTKFLHDVNPTVAQMMSDREDQGRIYADAISNAPPGLYGGLQTFAASALPQLLDPIGFAAGLLTGGAFAAGSAVRAGATGAAALRAGAMAVVNPLTGGATAAGLALNAERLAANSALLIGEQGAAKFARTEALKKFGVNAAEGFVGNLAADTLNVYAGKLDGKELDISDALVMNAVASAGFAGLFAGGRVVMNKFGGDPLMRAMDEAAVGRLMDSKDPTVVPKVLRANLVAETSGTAFPYTHTPFNPDAVMYSSSKIDIDYVNADHAPLDNRGNGVYLTDNLNAANGAASRAESVGGRVYEHNLTGKVILDANLPAPENMHASLSTLLGEDLDVSRPLREILDDVGNKVDSGEMPEQVFNRIDEMLTDGGYDGFHYEMDKLFGESHTKQNVVKIINPENLEVKSTFAPDKAKVGKLDRERIATLVKDSNASSFYSRVTKADAARIATEPEVIVHKPLDEADKILARFKEMESLPGHSTADDIKIHKEVNDKIARAKKLPALLDKIESCM